MAFKYCINSEYIFYREGSKNFQAALLGFRRIEYYEDYGEEIKAKITLPQTEESVVSAIQAIINWACCAEACLNKLYFDWGMDNAKYRKFTHKNVRLRIDELNDMFDHFISPKLKIRLLELAQARNMYVHFDEIPIVCGATVLTPEFKALSINKMLVYRTAIRCLGKAISALPYKFNILNAGYPIMGDGEIMLESENPEVNFKPSVARFLLN